MRKGKMVKMHPLILNEKGQATGKVDTGALVSVRHITPKGA